ncbi:MAG: sodium-dependent transporter [Eubacteriaceae bacterium]|nr:sodium-dependent transporter [Eubacteriaceae bacterium]
MEQQHHKGQWSSSFGFLMAAIGSAVGLGNLWGFPYKMGMNGGFAFLLLYLILVAFVGFVITTGELALGRRSGKGVVGAFRSIDSKYGFIGWFAWISPLLILGFYSMLGGYCLKYAIANLGDFFGASWGVNGMDSGEYFTAFFTNQFQTALFTVIFILLTWLIVKGGISGGIEKFTKVAMPALFVMLVIVIIRSVTLPGASEGIAFMFKPNWDVFRGSGFISVLAAAGGQMFFSLSLGMGITVTYGSYMKKTENIERNAIIVPIADTVIAIMAGIAVMPAVFASGLNPAGGPGLLFVTLQTVFQAMGGFGPIFGFILYGLVFIAAITSSIALLEAVSSVIMDRKLDKDPNADKKAVRNKSVLLVTAIVLIEGIFVSIDGLGANGLPQIFGQGCWLDSFDLISEGILMPLGACYMAIILPNSFVDEELTLEGNKFRTRKFYDFCIKFIAPLMMVLVLLGQIDSFFKLEIFG